MKNLLIAQSGGPTVAINATLAGIITGACVSGGIDKVYGALNGIQGVLNDNFVNLNELILDTQCVDLLCQTPAAALGSCRFKLSNPEEDDSQYKRIVEVLQKHNIGYFIYIGGNDSMDTVDKLSEYLVSHNVGDIKVVGAPKTIDNDLAETDHCPGFGSAAKYIATTFAELERDCSVYDIPAVTIVEVMGRNAGWLTASSALARLNGGRGPSLIYLCEKAFDIDRFVEDVKEEIKKHPDVIVAISEGIKDENGRYISEVNQSGATDMFGHSYIAGAAKVLEQVVRERIGCKVRSIEMNLMQRCAAHLASATDLSESKLLGMHAFQCAMEGMTGVMASVQRINDNPYEIIFRRVRVKDVANKEKTVPLDWITPDGHDVTPEMMQYLKPLIKGEVNTKYKNGIPEHIVIFKNGIDNKIDN
ncbi:MAG: 6-phosphofructokinase [Clostridiales bacterium]|nr:6-phosphofructokinase [Clostridiales bacterium]